MSVTTSTLSETLQDYEIRLTGPQDLPAAPRQQDTAAPSPQQQQQQQFPTWVPLTDHVAPDVENPADWDTEHRAVPRYRPINYHLNREQRPWGSNPIETAFVLHMFSGVWLTAFTRWAWTKTGGRFNNTFFRWKVGGEF